MERNEDEAEQLNMLLNVYGIAGTIATEIEDYEMCVKVTQRCQEIMKKLIDMGYDKADNGLSLKEMYAEGEALLAKQIERVEKHTVH